MSLVKIAEQARALLRSYETAESEADDGSGFVCCRCREQVSAVEGGTDLAGLCAACWSAVYLWRRKLEQLTGESLRRPA